MPNITENKLIVRGDKELLQYFYDKNRVTEEDIKFCRDFYYQVTELSFTKFVPRISNEILHQLVEKKCRKEKIDLYALTCEFWGTKWNAFEVKVFKEKMEEGELSYTFETAWNYPYNWLLSISEIFPQLEFEIITSNEDDGYDAVYHFLYKNKQKTEIKRYTHLDLWMEEKGGKEKILNDLLENIGKKEYLDDLRKIVNQFKEKKKEWYHYPYSNTFEIMTDWIEKHDEVKQYLEENFTYHQGNRYYYHSDFINSLIKRIEE